MQSNKQISFQHTHPNKDFFAGLDADWKKLPLGISRKEKVAARTKVAAIAQTAGFSRREGFKYNCPHGYTSHSESGGRYTVSLDWLQLGIVLHDSITQTENGEDFTKGSFRFVCRPIGTTHYKYAYDVYKENDQYFTLEVCPRNTAAKEKNNGLLKLENWLLYSDWYGVLSGFIEHNIKSVLRISRVDIAIDGLNYIYDLLSDYGTLISDGYAVKLLGKSKVSGGALNRLTRIPESFKIGNPKGLKQIAIYNKTKDIERTSKNYIKHFWEANGLTLGQANYRFEMRLKNNYIKQLTGDKVGDEYNPLKVLEALNGDAFKVDLVRKACESFFEWVYIDDKNASRCTRVNLLPLPEHDLNRTNLTYNGTAYKAKMQVHNTFMQIAKNIVGTDEGIAIIGKQLHVYELHDWYRSRFLDFSKKYDVNDFQTEAELMCLGKPLITTSDKRVQQIMKGMFYSKNAVQKKLLYSKLCLL